MSVAATRTPARPTSRRARIAAPALLTALVLILYPAGTTAQEISGVALGPDGQPLANHTVILHRVGAGGGAMAGTDTTDADGAFAFTLDGDDQSVYFAALRYDGELYIGPAAQGDESVAGYVLEVSPSSAIGGIGGAAGGGGMVPARAPRTAPAAGGSSDSGALWLVALLALAAAAAFVFTAPRYRRRRTRDALIELAGIENRLAQPSSELSGEERERLEARHDRLKGQLAPQG